MNPDEQAIKDPSAPDLKRLLAAAKALDQKGQKPTVPNLASTLEWEMARVRTAIAAGEERGNLRIERHRRR